MGTDEVSLNDKAKRTRDLLSSFYSQDPSVSSNSSIGSSRSLTLDDINSTSFDPDHYMNNLVHKSNLEGLLQRHVEMAAEIKNLDTDLQMLVYENYNKFISATDTIKRMKSNISGMEANMEQLLEKIMSVQSRSDTVNTSLYEKREHVEKLHRTCNLLRKVQFIYDLPDRLGKCIKSEAYADAVRFYTGAMPIFKAYGDSSFQDCKRESEKSIAIIINNLQGRLFSDSESMQARSEAAVLLKQLDFPVENLKAKLLEKLEQSITDIQLNPEEINNASTDPSPFASAHEAAVQEFVEAVHAFRVIFPDSEKQLNNLAQDLITKNFIVIEEYVKRRICAADLLGVLRVVWNDVLLIDDVLQEAALSDHTIEASKVTVRLYVSSALSHLLQDISDSLVKVLKKEKVEDYSLQVALDASTKTVLQGSSSVLLDFRKILDDNSGLVVRLREIIIDIVQEELQDFFRQLEDKFLLFSGRNFASAIQDQGVTEGAQGDKAIAGLILVLSQLSAFIEQTTIPRITEEIATSFSGGSARGYEQGPAFVPGEICRKFRSAGEKFLHQYINMRTQKISLLLKKRFNTPNWVKHKEPREVHMFVDLFFQELEITGNEVKQILPQGKRRHRRTDSNGSTASSRSNPLREEKLSRSNTHRARSQLLETHLAKLFKQKVEIFTKVEYTQESVVTTIVKLCLKSLQEFVRLHTFNRSGFQQIQLDIQFLRTSLRETVEDEAAMDFLLDEVIVAAAERCLDPVPLEPPILDKLIQVKLAKTKEHNTISP
ncbi:vacuolar protein sorting-associated protein 51 homolog [Neltuma alba]|uniref:vacuolar protein sorting-associated protein 51 homolog n=1 Tax=Neltuma alba TaxID=207710 RepID=UPI0010A44652|nr:vacuolar protein sorting-associated protein 51 homolog [Prosopis alba]XP_028786339.1 vacuolar protein sorting-associated protein 51 homolog [Prosopis alba]